MLWPHRALVMGWLSVQVLLPLRYYVQGRHVDPLDERYAFRMFSLTDMGGTTSKWWYWKRGEDLKGDGHVLDVRRVMGEAWLLRFDHGAPADLHYRAAWRTCVLMTPQKAQAVAFQRIYEPWSGTGQVEDVGMVRC